MTIISCVGYHYYICFDLDVWPKIKILCEACKGRNDVAFQDKSMIFGMCKAWPGNNFLSYKIGQWYLVHVNVALIKGKDMF